MGWGQLYYTSCEKGLSPYAGFQFNAATPGIPAEVMREVEGLTSYEPPRSLSYHPDRAAIESSPVNLVYRPGPAGVLASVRFVGEDFSHRMGNYFAHSIVPMQGDEDFDSSLPIEFWDSRFWVHTPASQTELPALATLPDRGPIRRASVDRFLAGRFDVDFVARLLTAAEQAVTQERRSVILVVPEVATAVHWIGALSYLLPPAMARKMAFMTYHRRPDQVRSHVVATLPDSDLELNEAAFRDNLLFDLCSNRTSEVAAHPAAQLAAQAGVAGSEKLWQEAREWVAAEPETFEEWHAALAVSALLNDRALAEEDLDPVCGWLSEYGQHSQRDVVRRVVNGVLEHPGMRPEYLRPLVDAARRLGAEDTLTRIERRAIDTELTQLSSGAEPLSTGIGPSTRGSREFATQRCTELLAQATDAATAFALLDWTAQTVPKDLPPSDVLRACAHDLLGPELLAHPEQQVLDVLTGDRALMTGALAFLDEVSERQPQRVQQVLGLGLWEAARQAEVDLPPGLHWMVLVEIGRGTDPYRYEKLADELGGRPELAARVLHALWPEGRWPVPDALALVPRLTDAEVRQEPWSAWLSETCLRPGKASTDDFSRLVAIVLDRDLIGSPGSAALKAVRAFDATVQAVNRAIDDRPHPADHLRALGQEYLEGTEMEKAFLRGTLPALIDRLVFVENPNASIKALPGPVLHAYANRCQRRLAMGGDAAVETAVKSFMLYARLDDKEKVLRPMLREVLREGLRKWPKRRISRVEKELRRSDPEVGGSLFPGFRSGELAGVLAKVYRRLVIVR
jgi:GTPase-associated protein 1, N-terminal domain type 2/GTPase-associated protein 1, C-terminal domain/GTPase-associated protein 1, middle domain